MNSLLQRVILFWFILLTCFAPVSSAESHPDICKPGGYVIGFFNGVWNTKKQAEGGLFKLETTLFGENHNEEPIEYELFHNQSGLEREGATSLEDLAEVFIQRAEELDGVLANRWEIFWETLADSPDEGNFVERIASKIANISRDFKKLLSALYTDLVSQTVSGLANLFSEPPTDVDYAAHQTRVKALAIEGKKLILIAHSQGNLFMNPAYDAALTVTNADSVKAIHIAPASTTVRGQHILANLDLVINGLRIQGFSTVPSINAELPTQHLVDNDASGHTLINTYLNTERDTHTKVKAALQTALDEVETPNTQGSEGFFTVTLTWDGAGDMDLHSFEPNGEQVYFLNKAGKSGYLDYDNRSANGPEHYYASCDPNQLDTGIYQIGINNHRGATGRNATIQVASAKEGVLHTSTRNIGQERPIKGTEDPIRIVNVKVSQDEKGNYKAEIE